MNEFQSLPRISLAKCWQTESGSLVFQCSLQRHQGQNSLKGFLVLNPVNSANLISFQESKPDGNLSANGVAAIVRKYCPTSRISSVALSPDNNDRTFLRLKMESNSQNEEIYLVISAKPEPEIDFILGKYSLARVKQRGSFTVRKPIGDWIQTAEEIPGEGLETWISNLIGQLRVESKLESSPAPLSNERRTARDKIARRLKTLKKTLTQDLSKLPSMEELKISQNNAALLAQYVWLLKPGMFQLNLDSSQTGSNPITLDINPEISPGQNLENYFAKVKKLERAFKLQGERIRLLKQQIHSYEEILEKLRNSALDIPASELGHLLAERGLKVSAAIKPNKESSIKGKPWIGRKFCLENGVFIYVGRDSEESDRLVKSARSNDWWLHIAVSGQGSHVIVTGLPAKSPLPSQVFRDAAILALHFSTRSQSKEGEVYCTRRQFIRKRKGMAPGLWLVDRSETFMVRYEPNEVSAIFAKEIRNDLK